MKLKFLDLKEGYEELKPEIDSAITRVLNSGQFILGEELLVFEQEWADFCGAQHSVGVANGLDALVLSLRALGIGLGDEVLVPTNTFIASWLAVSSVGATPVGIEPDPRTHNLNPSLLEAAITSKTKAVMPVHLYGQSADLEEILAVAKLHNLWVIEDAAQAHGTLYKGRRVGSHGDAVCWSFYPGKNLGAYGDAGAITSNNAQIIEQATLLRNYGAKKKYLNEVKGVNSRLDPLQAAILRVKLRHLDGWNAKRATVADVYSTEICNPNVTLPLSPAWSQSSWHLYVIRHPERDLLKDRLAEHGVEASIHYPVSPHRQPAYAAEFAANCFPIADMLAGQVLSLPIGPHISVAEAQHVASLVNKHA